MASFSSHICANAYCMSVYVYFGIEDQSYIYDIKLSLKVTNSPKRCIRVSNYEKNSII